MVKNVILDLDETLIHCPSAIKTLSPSCFHLKCHHIFIDKELYLIFERPFLAQFLQGLRGKRIGIWTAGDKTYAEFIARNILQPYLLPDQRFEFVLNRDHCNQSMQRFNVLKHVNYVSQIFHPTETLIIDDNDELISAGNNVHVMRPFKLNPDDTELLSTLQHV